MSNSFLSRLKEFFDKYEARISSGTLILGFVIDFLTLNRADSFWDNFFIVLYLVIAGVSILVINLYEDGRLRNKFFETICEFLPFTMQFAFGGLFSAFTIFYSKSSSLIASGVFLLILFTLLVGNEFFRKRYQKLVFQTSIYFLAIFFFFIYLLPVLLKKMGALVFIGSGAVSLVFTSIFIFLIARHARGRFEENYKRIFVSVGAIYIFINFLYFTNVIPPIPLSLKLGQVYHTVHKFEGGYLVTGELQGPWYNRWFSHDKIHVSPDASAYVFTSIFAPMDLGIKVVHDWQYFDEEKNKWLSLSRVTFPIKGGRAEGYRGFTKKGSMKAGAWRVDVKTERGQTIGRVRFNVEIGAPENGLRTKTI